MEWQVGETLNDVDGAEDQFGRVIVLSQDGTVMAISSPDYSSNTGRVRVFALTNGAWVQRGESMVGESNNDRSGRAIDLSGDGTVIAIGAQYNNDNTGHVRVYAWSAGAWTQRGSDINGMLAEEEFGRRLRLSRDGTVLAVGAPYSGTGHVRVYVWTGGLWAQRGDELIGLESNDQFGYDVALSADGTVLAVGAPANQSDRGVVGVYKWASNVWTLRDDFIIGNAENNRFGNSVDLSANGSVLAVGAPDSDLYRGHASVLVWDGDAWQARDEITGSEIDETFGRFVRISADGTVLAVGVPTGADVVGTGFVSVFAWRNGSWAARGDRMYGLVDGDNFGRGLALSDDGTVLAIGAPNHNNDAGYVSVFRWRNTYPCFHGSVWLPTAAGGVRASNVRVGMLLVAEDGGRHRVRNVTRTANARCVCIHAGAFGPNVPSEPVILTPTHLVRLPAGNIVPAGHLVSLPSQVPGQTAASIVPQPLTVYHVGVDDWVFVRAHNLSFETLAWKPAHYAQRHARPAARSATARFFRLKARGRSGSK